MLYRLELLLQQSFKLQQFPTIENSACLGQEVGLGSQGQEHSLRSLGKWMGLSQNPADSGVSGRDRLSPQDASLQGQRGPRPVSAEHLVTVTGCQLLDFGKRRTKERETHPWDDKTVTEVLCNATGSCLARPGGRMGVG